MLALASSGALLVVQGIWGLVEFCDCWRLPLRAGELPECPRRAVLERKIGASANCVDADMLYLTARLVSSHVCAAASVACFSRCFHLVAGAMSWLQVLYGI